METAIFEHDGGYGGDGMLGGTAAGPHAQYADVLVGYWVWGGIVRLLAAPFVPVPPWEGVEATWLHSRRSPVPPAEAPMLAGLLQFSFLRSNFRGCRIHEVHGVGVDNVLKFQRLLVAWWSRRSSCSSSWLLV